MKPFGCGQLGHRLGAVDRAQQREAVRIHLEVGVVLGAIVMHRQRDHRVSAVDGLRQGGPPGLALSDRLQRRTDLQWRGQARPGALTTTEAPVAAGPLAQLGQSGQRLLDHERVDGLLVGEPEVDQQFGEGPGGEFGLLGLTRFRQIRRSEATARDQPGADRLFGAGQHHVADRPVAQPDRGFHRALAGGLDVHTARGFRV